MASKLQQEQELAKLMASMTAETAAPAAAPMKSRKGRLENSAPTASPAIDVSVPLTSADGFRNPPVATEAMPGAFELSPVRWSHGIFGILVFAFATAVWIVLVAAAKSLYVDLYTWLMAATPPFAASSWNIGLWFPIAVSVLGFVEGVFVFDKTFEIIGQAISRKFVNGLRTVLEIATAIPITWFAAQISFDAAVFELILLVGTRMAIFMFLHSAEREDNYFGRDKARGGVTSRPSYYTNIGFAFVEFIFTWSILTTRMVDAMYWANIVGLKSLRLAVLIVTFILMVLHDLGLIIMYLIRYWRTDTGCFQRPIGFEISTQLLRNVINLWLLVVVLIVVYYPANW